MNSPTEQARHFLKNEKAFRLGTLPTETSHPKTATLSHVIASDIADGLRMLMQVDEDIPAPIANVMAGPEFAALIDALFEAVSTGKRVFLTGCGSTGRLSILLEAAWRGCWQELCSVHPDLCDRLPERESTFTSVMAGGDFALIRSVEGFEDSTNLGAYQLAQAGVASGDVVIAITEGGETSFVIGTAWEGLRAGAKVFFVCNNPLDVLRKHVERSREIIDEPRITKLDLFTGPMAISGSTRMQATTAELLVVGAAMELALLKVLEKLLPPQILRQLDIPTRRPQDYLQHFDCLLDQLRRDGNVKTIAELIQWEETIYRQHGLVTYMTDDFLLDVLTDTTERAPTFRLPPFRKCDDTTSPRSWAFVKNPHYDSRQTWSHVLRREPRGIDWPLSVYQSLDVSAKLIEEEPKLDNSQIWKFLIGNERDASRFEAVDSGLAMILVGDEIAQHGPRREEFDREFHRHATSYAKTAAIAVGPSQLDRDAQSLFHVACDLPASPLRLWDRLAVKLVLNLMSTATMARMGRVEGNYMSWVETSNKKLVDRATRLIVQLAAVDYEKACYALHEAIDAVRDKQGTASAVAVAVEKLRGDNSQ